MTFNTYHQPKSTSSNSEHVANASNPMAERPCDFHMSIDTIFLLYWDIVSDTSSIFTWPNAKLMCFSAMLFFRRIIICSSAMSAWNKSSRSRLRNRAKGLPVMSRREAFRNDNSSLLQIKKKMVEWNILRMKIVLSFYLSDYHKRCSLFLSYRHLKISPNSVLYALFDCRTVERNCVNGNI